MKNFSELLDTDTSLKVRITISPIADNGYPTAWIKINNQVLFSSQLKTDVTVDMDLPLLEPMRIEIGMADKCYGQLLETAVVIKSVRIDDFEVIPNWTNLSEYINERSINRPVSYLGYNGTWILDITEPFYQWRHRVTGQGWLLKPVA